MKKKHLSSTVFIIIAALLAGAVYWYYTADNSTREAAQIFDEIGIKGGLVVPLGCEDAQLTAGLHAIDRYLVHGLAREKETVEKARRYIHSRDLYGPVTVEQWESNYLPYLDNLVNLFVADDLDGISMDEVMRVLAPNGIACIKEEGEWQTREKDHPDNTDEWSHHLHGPANNAVARDTEIAPLRHLQWKGGPMFSRSHDLIPSIRAMVSAGGRIFYVIDEASLGIKDRRVPSQWRLVARDAYNGVILWILIDGVVEYLL